MGHAGSGRGYQLWLPRGRWTWALCLDPPEARGQRWREKRQRYAFGFLAKGGFPTYLGAPLAFNSADLKAGKIDVALVGLTIEDQVIPGASLAANAMRTLKDYSLYPSATDSTTGVDYLPAIAVADYGNVASHLGQNERSLEEVHKVISEILAGDAVPIALGGTHVQMYGLIAALAQKYGPKSFVLVHIDAHYDALSIGIGRFVHNGNMIYQAVERGLINGEDIVQIGLRGSKPDPKDFKWMMDRRLKFHFQAEIARDGFAKVLERLRCLNDCWARSRASACSCLSTWMASILPGLPASEPRSPTA